MRQVLRAGALGRPRGMGWRGRQEGGSGRRTHVNPWLIHFNKYYLKKIKYVPCLSLSGQVSFSNLHFGYFHSSLKR